MMLNSVVKERLAKTSIRGPEIIELAEHMAEVAQKNEIQDIALVTRYATVEDSIKPGEFVVEIHLVVKKVPENA